MSYRLIALDIDGTIRSRDRPISDKTRESIERVKQAGATVTLATGRTYWSAVRSSAELAITNPIASFQGAQVSDPTTHRVMWHQPLTAAMARMALDALQEWSVEIVAYHKDEVYVSEMTRFAEGYRERNLISVELVDDLLHLVDWNLTRLMAAADEEVIRDLNDHLNRTIGDDLYITRSLPNFCEILNPAGGKEKALSWICDYLGIDHSETLVFGNGYNDVRMLEWAALGVAVGDAVEEVKEVADIISPDLENDGVAQTLDKMLEAGDIG